MIETLTWLAVALFAAAWVEYWRGRPRGGG